MLQQMNPSRAPYLNFNDGQRMPQLGLGVWQVSDEEVGPAIHAALAAGYRLFDTAAMYDNEAGVGRAIRDAAIPREELFVTTKLWNDQQGAEKTRKAMQESLEKLQLDYMDLYLIHWPAPENDRFVETWRTLLELREEGLAKSIGVSNFNPAHLTRLIDETGCVPAVNQIELHPLFPQTSLREFHSRHGIVTQSWSPLARGDIIGDNKIARIARKHGKTPAQIVIRWHLENGLAVIPKTTSAARVRENIAVFDFQLEEADMHEIATLECGRRLGPDPEDFS